MNEPQVIHERVDDVPVLMHVLRERLALDQLLDEQVARHGNWQGLSFDEVAVTWLTHILTENDHNPDQGKPCLFTHTLLLLQNVASLSYHQIMKIP